MILLFILLAALKHWETRRYREAAAERTHAEKVAAQREEAQRLVTFIHARYDFADAEMRRVAAEYRSRGEPGR